MRFNILSSVVSLVAIAAPFVLGQAETNENVITAPAAMDTWSAGTPFEIKWTVSADPAIAAGTVSIILVKGLQTNLQVVETIAPAVANNGLFTWTPPLYLEGMQTMPADHIYGFKIVTDKTGNFGWSPPFKINSPQSTFDAAATSAVSTTGSTTATSATSTDAPTSTSVTSTESETTSTSETSTSTSTSASTTESSTTASSKITTSTTSSASVASKTTTSTTSSASETAAEATETEAETESPSPSAAPVAASGLSTVAIAGISASAVAAVAIGILAFFLIRRRKRNNRQRLVGSTVPPSKYDKDFQMMERRAKHRPTSSFGFNTSRSDTSGALVNRDDPYVQLDDRNGDYRAYPARPSRSSRGSDTWAVDNARF